MSNSSVHKLSIFFYCSVVTSCILHFGLDLPAPDLNFLCLTEIIVVLVFCESFRETLLAYRDAVTSLAQRLLSLMTENLGLPSGAFEAISREQHVHFVYYPPCPQPQLALGIKSHADSGSVTILQQDEVGGLQVSNNGRWIAVEPIPSSFVINLADAMQASLQNLTRYLLLFILFTAPSLLFSL